MNIVRDNKLRGIAATVLRHTAALCSTGPLMQTLIEILGFDSSLNYMHTTLLQVASVSSIILSSRWADKGNIIKRTAAIQIPFAILFLFYIPLCLTKTVSLGMFLLLLIIGILQSVFGGLFTVCDYKLPYFVFHPEEYGTITAIAGIISSLITFGISSLISKLMNFYNYKLIMLFAFLLSALFMAIAIVLFFHQKSLIDMDSIQAPVENKKKVRLSMVFKHPVFIKLAPANLLRGFANGTVTVLAIIAFELGFDEKTTAIMVSLQSISLLTGCAIFGYSSKYLSPRISVFAGSLLFFLLPLMLIQNKIIFLLSYAIVFFGRTLVDYAVPAVLIKAVPVEIAGPYNAWRMILHNAGTLIGTSVAAIISPQLLFIITIVSQLISGFLYFSSKELKNCSPIFVRLRR